MFCKQWRLLPAEEQVFWLGLLLFGVFFCFVLKLQVFFLVNALQQLVVLAVISTFS